MNEHLLTLAELGAAPWASCGPAALAALFGRPLAEVRHAFPAQNAVNTWTNKRHMDHALHALGQAWCPTPIDGRLMPAAPAAKAKQTTLFADPTLVKSPAVGADTYAMPRHGLALLQFRGSWDVMPVNHPAQLQRTHWIAVKPHEEHPATTLVFDVNAIDDFQPLSLGWWQPCVCWEQLLVPQIAEHFGPKATGAWWVRAGIELAR